jgi:aspartate kinase
MRLVMKFGGTAVDSSDKVRHVAKLVKSYHDKGDQIVCVTSAVRGMTDGLLEIAESVRRGDRSSIEDFVKKSRKVHEDIAQGAITDEKLKREALATVGATVGELEDVLGGIVLLGEVTPKSLDYLMSFGERLSTPVVSFALQDIGVDSEHLTGKEAGVVTDSNFGEAKPLIDTTKLRVGLRLEPVLKRDAVPVITGFIGADQHGNTTTIGRGGSDYTATIVAASIGADEVWLWSDVDGLMTKHPRVGHGQLIPNVDHINSHILAIAHAAPGTDGGTGGMSTKIRAAQLATRHGVTMVVASGQKPGVLARVLANDTVGRRFLAVRRSGGSRIPVH